MKDRCRVRLVRQPCRQVVLLPGRVNRSISASADAATPTTNDSAPSSWTCWASRSRLLELGGRAVVIFSTFSLGWSARNTPAPARVAHAPSPGQHAVSTYGHSAYWRPYHRGDNRCARRGTCRTGEKHESGKPSPSIARRRGRAHCHDRCTTGVGGELRFEHSGVPDGTHPCDATTASQCIANNGLQSYFFSAVETAQATATRSTCTFDYEPVTDVSCSERTISTGADVLVFDSTYASGFWAWTYCPGASAKLGADPNMSCTPQALKYDPPTPQPTIPSPSATTLPATNLAIRSACVTAATRRPVSSRTQQQAGC